MPTLESLRPQTPQRESLTYGHRDSPSCNHQLTIKTASINSSLQTGSASSLRRDYDSPTEDDRSRLPMHIFKNKAGRQQSGRRVAVNEGDRELKIKKAWTDNVRDLRDVRKDRRAKRLFQCFGTIVDSYVVVFLTTVMTLWVLMCDDVRVIFTQKPKDDYFEILLIACMVVFGLEILLASLGKEDYFMSFFFVLDLVSTGSLVLDLPSLQEKMARDAEGISNATDTNTARIGAKAARVVRIVRLVRIVKLYKIAVNYFEKSMDSWMGTAEPGEDSSFMEEDLNANPDDEQHAQKETRVGKQWSQVNLKRVIFLILAMLIVVPSLSATATLKYSWSSDFGADEIWETFVSMRHGDVSRLFYEKSMLRFIYYHNWFTGNDKCPDNKHRDSYCPAMYYSHLFWVGIAGQQQNTVNADVHDAELSLQTVMDWETNVSSQNDIYNYGGMPSAALAVMGSHWTQDCSRTLSDGSREHVQGFSLLSYSAGGKVHYKVHCPWDLRATEYDRFFPRLIDHSVADHSHFVFFFDQRQFLKEEAMYGLLITAYVCVALVIAVMFFAQDANRLVLWPLESMIAKVKIIREDPLAAIKMGDDEFRTEEQHRIRAKRSKARMGAKNPCAYCLACIRMITGAYSKRSGQGGQPMETMILEKTLLKLGALLALGFGEAGANIINKNMTTEDTATVDVMIKGDKVQCIYAQARIQDFSVVTEVLQSKVMTFVNQIAEIVHGVVVSFNGGANKNFGDTFLLVWRSISDERANLSKLANCSIAAFCRILSAIQQSPRLAAYRAHPRLQFLLGRQYRVCLNIGVHAGWAFEGAMGSEYKIDASYISTNLTITGNVEQAAQHFRSSFLATDSVVELCCQPIQDVCRLIDMVTIPGHAKPIELYCIDLDVAALDPDESAQQDYPFNPRTRYHARQFLEAERRSNWADDNYPARVITADPDIILMRKRYTNEFLQRFNMGFKNYTEGDWPVASGFLQHACIVLGSTDGPCESLLAFMQQNKFVTPKDWKGHRDIMPLLNGPPKHPPRPPHDPPGGFSPPCMDFFDKVSSPADGITGSRDFYSAAGMTLPNAVPHEFYNNRLGLQIDPFNVPLLKQAKSLDSSDDEMFV